MDELSEILAACRRADEAGRPAVLATVVRVAGSTYRRPGARMVFLADAEPVGFISGGCLEGDLAERARSVVESGEAQTVVYDMRSPDDVVWGLGLGCGGEVRVLLERLSPGERPAHLEFLESCRQSREAGAVATVFRVEGGLDARVGDRVTLRAGAEPRVDIESPKLGRRIAEDVKSVLERGASEVKQYGLADGIAEVLVEYVSPLVSLVVFGAGGDALPLVRFAKALGWHVTIADNRSGYANAERFPEADAIRLVDFDRLEEDAPPIDELSPVVVMTHHFLRDLELMRFLLPSRAPYLGFLGPRKRTEMLLAELASEGVRPTRTQLGRVFGPVGIDIGSETPEEIALSALAEIRAVLGGRDGGFLKDRSAPLHDATRT